MSCLKCGCKRPATIPPNPSSADAGLGGVAQLLNVTNVGKSEIERKLAENDEKAERWLSKVSQLNDSADLSSLAEDENFPEIMPMRKGVNKFVVSTRKTPLERRLANAQYSNNGPQAASSDSKISQTLDRILGRSNSTAASNNQPGTGDALKKSTDQLSSVDPVPFVPLPADMFAKPQCNNGQGNLDDQINAEADSSMENRTVPLPESQYGMESSDTAEKWSKKVAEPDSINDVTSVTSNENVPEIMPMRKGENRFVVSKKKDRSLTSPQYKRRSLLEHADNSDFIPFVPFPPGYFAKKDKPVESTAETGIVSEGSPSSENRMETSASSEKFGNRSNTSQVVGSQPKGNMNIENWNRNYSQQNSSSGVYGESNNYQHQSQSHGAQSWPSGTANTGTWNTGHSQGHFNESRGESTYNGANSAQQPYNSGYNNSSNSWSSENNNSNTAWTGNSNYNNNSAWRGNNNSNNNNAWSSNTSYSNSSTWNGNDSSNSNTWSSSHGYNNNATWSNNSHNAWSSSYNNNQGGSFADNSNATSSSSSMNANQTVHNSGGYGGSSNRGYTGKSLEGSAVKDPDPLDMSEEAKAERWFRRAAQIKDISELANIPDEDFPEIMPMRKGVNRFVVSKRKTPLERRLTSPQYRRNLPVDSSEPERDAS